MNHHIPDHNFELTPEILQAVRNHFPYLRPIDNMPLVRSQSSHDLRALARSPSPDPIDRVLPSRFFALATAAYAEAVTIPESPPPGVWAPGDELDSYYEVRLYKFHDQFDTTLASQGDNLGSVDRVYRNEWLVHSRSIMDNIRREWHAHAWGAMGGWKSTVPNNPRTAAANLAIDAVMDKAPGPAARDWPEKYLRDETCLADLHVFHQLMLVRFQYHMGLKVRDERRHLNMSDGDIEAGVKQYCAIIMREYRKTWVAMFGSARARGFVTVPMAPVV